MKEIFKIHPQSFVRKHLNKDVNESILIPNGHITLRFRYDSVKKIFESRHRKFDDCAEKEHKDYEILINKKI